MGNSGQSKACPTTQSMSNCATGSRSTMYFTSGTSRSSNSQRPINTPARAVQCRENALMTRASAEAEIAAALMSSSSEINSSYAWRRVRRWRTADALGPHRGRASRTAARLSRGNIATPACSPMNTTIESISRIPNAVSPLSKGYSLLLLYKRPSVPQPQRPRGNARDPPARRHVPVDDRPCCRKGPSSHLHRCDQQAVAADEGAFSYHCFMLELPSKLHVTVPAPMLAPAPTTASPM